MAVLTIIIHYELNPKSMGWVAEDDKGRNCYIENPKGENA